MMGLLLDEPHSRAPASMRGPHDSCLPALLPAGQLLSWILAAGLQLLRSGGPPEMTKPWCHLREEYIGCTATLLVRRHKPLLPRIHFQRATCVLKSG